MKTLLVPCSSWPKNYEILKGCITKEIIESCILKEMWKYMNDVHNDFSTKNNKSFILEEACWLYKDLIAKNLAPIYEGLYKSREIIIDDVKFFFSRGKSVVDISQLTVLQEKNLACHSTEKIDLVVAFVDGDYILKGVEDVKINLDAGDVMLYRSDKLVRVESSGDTGNSPNSDELQYIAGLIVRMIPCTLTNFSYKERIKCYRSSKSFRSEKEGADDAQPFFFRYTPPKLSYREGELYGVIPYNSNKRRNNILEGIYRGIVFSDDSFYDLVPSESESIKDIVNEKQEEGFLDVDWHKKQCQNYQNVRTELLYMKDNEPLKGQDKYLGGVASPCGKYIYGVPGYAKQVLCIDILKNELSYIGPIFEGNFKWLRGIEIPPTKDYPNGICIALPSNAHSVLKIDPKTNLVKTFGSIKSGKDGTWMYHGGGLDPVTNLIYAVPANANRVLVIDVFKETIWEIGPDFGEQKQKWYGGIYSCYNHCIYGIPHNATGVLKINLLNEKCEIINSNFESGNWKWHGGLITDDGKLIIGFPNNSNQILKIDIIDQDQEHVYTISSPNSLKSGRHRHPHNGKYKYLGGALSSDQKYAYLFPSDSERVLKIHLYSNTLERIGPFLLDGASKYQNGFCSSKDGCIYGIPQNARSIIRVIPSQQLQNKNDLVDMVFCGDSLVDYKDKFEGAVMCQKGNIYCIPLRAKAVLKIIPPEKV